VRIYGKMFGGFCFLIAGMLAGGSAIHFFFVYQLEGFCASQGQAAQCHIDPSAPLGLLLALVGFAAGIGASTLLLRNGIREIRADFVRSVLRGECTEDL
jgi:hypothetical protein